MPTLSHVWLDGRRLTETEHQKLLLEEEHAADETPACVYSLATLEAVTPRPLLARAWRDAAQDPALVGDAVEA